MDQIRVDLPRERMQLPETSRSCHNHTVWLSHYSFYWQRQHNVGDSDFQNVSHMQQTGNLIVQNFDIYLYHFVFEDCDVEIKWTDAQVHHLPTLCSVYIYFIFCLSGYLTAIGFSHFWSVLFTVDSLFYAST